MTVPARAAGLLAATIILALPVVVHGSEALPRAKPPAPPAIATPAAAGAAAQKPLVPYEIAAPRPSDVAKELFGRVPVPADLPARAIGWYSRGCLQGAVQLPSDGQTWQAMRPSRNRAWGHPELIDVLKDLAADAPATGWNGLLVGDLAQPRGGPMLTGHASHQIGLDADIWLTPMPDRTLTEKEREETSAVSMLVADHSRVDPAIWTDSHARLIRRAASDPRVERILVHPAIKRALCEFADGKRMAGRKPVEVVPRARPVAGAPTAPGELPPDPWPREADASAPSPILMAAATVEGDQMRIGTRPPPSALPASSIEPPPASVWLRKVRPWYGHHYHFHVRIGCPEGSPGCRAQDPTPPGAGCGAALDWWFTEEPYRPRGGSGQRREITIGGLPAECRQVLVAR